ncbi:hypothetical protein PanWU01x14_004400 [Parasponia andersonii]|uniref:Uncharacterized protein n=1 Tax=Parasponia andersonii TaxID=3476 RepID=A0A2P5E3A2_PARAD|nr:hypothetical protein PanWU01x14_004400 [Parasponia andersonii]
MVAVASNNLRQKEKDPNKLRKVPILEPKRSSISHNYDELVKCLLKHRSSPSESERLSEEELAFLDDKG